MSLCSVYVIEMIMNLPDVTVTYSVLMWTKPYCERNAVYKRTEEDVNHLCFKDVFPSNIKEGGCRP